MKKSDLKTGQRVQMRNGNIFLVLKDAEMMLYGHEDYIFVSNNSFAGGSYYKGDLSHKRNKQYDIVKVFDAPNTDSGCCTKQTLDLTALSDPIWVRDLKEMTVAEIEKELGYPIKIVK